MEYEEREQNEVVNLGKESYEEVDQRFEVD
jgi:hypothetical protein